MIRFFAKSLALLLVLSFVAAVLQAMMNPSPAVPRETTEQIAAQSREAKEIMSRAFVVGKTMAKSGAVKPTAKQIDAMSRAAHEKMGNTRSQRWFKQYFESGFWEGWKSR